MNEQIIGGFIGLALGALIVIGIPIFMAWRADRRDSKRAWEIARQQAERDKQARID